MKVISQFRLVGRGATIGVFRHGAISNGSSGWIRLCAVSTGSFAASKVILEFVVNLLNVVAIRCGNLEKPLANQVQEV